jgi:uncharacterized protein YndB with AHSA1/START domain
MEQARLAEKPSLVLTRFYPVEPEKVWRAWTDAQALKRWWGPGGAEPVALAELDLRKGGRFRIVFGGAQGSDHEVQGTYKEVLPNRKLVFTWTWPRTTPERESVVTIELKEVPRGTELLFRHEQLYDESVRDGHRRGWTESFAKLERLLLAERPKLTLKRVYPVAPERVWRAWTEAGALRQWFGQGDAPGWIGELDVRVGGALRLVLRDPEGIYHDVRGTYREVVPHRRLVFTWNIHDAPPEAESVVSVVLEPVPGGTELEFTLDPVFDPRAADGWRGALKRLEDLVSTL